MFLLLICCLCQKLLAWLLPFQVHRCPSSQFYLQFCKLAQNMSGDKTAVDNSYTRVYANTFTKRKEPLRLLQTARVVGRFSVP
uniref:Putative secreted protein n=1 Tax=Ixodes ricinus TaxID=34613 RepID=A0A6B0TXC4_IXORI